MPRSRTRTHEKIIDTAHRLFYAQGYQATGVDRVVAETGITKKTLYNHFPSKSQLVVATLTHRDNWYLEWMETEIARRSRSPRDRFLVLLDALGDWTAEFGRHGCMFNNALAEYDASDPEVKAAVAAHKQRVIAFLADLAGTAGSDDPEGTARRAALIIEGVVSMARFMPIKQVIAEAKPLMRAAASYPHPGDRH